jgi:CheY-like chemotaxis protein
MPIVVISESDDQALAVRAVGSGAQDYLVKGRLSADLLACAIRYAIERQRLENALDQAEEWERQSWTRTQAARDHRYYSAMSKDGGAAASELTAELAAEYRDLVIAYVQSDRAIEVRPIKRLRELARRLAAAGVAARDVMRFHLDLLAELERLAGPDELPEVLTDVRLVLLDLMGSLADEYREESRQGGERSEPAR